MSKDRVFSVEHREDVFVTPIQRRDVFQYRHQKGWYGWERRGLQRVCFWILKNLGVFYLEPLKNVQITKRLVNPDKFMQRLYEQRRNLWQYFRSDPTTLLIGADDYDELLDEISQMPNRFSFMGEFVGADRKICGLRVHVIPWMKGMVVLPKGIVP